jgi:hypothetical protein
MFNIGFWLHVLASDLLASFITGLTTKPSRPDAAYLSYSH